MTHLYRAMTHLYRHMTGLKWEQALISFPTWVLERSGINKQERCCCNHPHGQPLVRGKPLATAVGLEVSALYRREATTGFWSGPASISKNAVVAATLTVSH